MHARTDPEHVKEGEQQAYGKQDKQRHDVAAYHLQLDGCHAEGDQIVGESAAEVPDDGLRYMFVHLHPAKEPAYQKASDKGAAEYRQHQHRPCQGYQLADSVSAEGDERHDGEVEGHGVQGDGGEGGLAHAAALVFRKNTGAQFGREILEALQEGCLPAGGSPGDQPHAYHHRSDDSHGCGRHCERLHLFHAIAGEGFADGGGCSVSSAESGGHRKAKGFVHRPEKAQHPQA